MKKCPYCAEGIQEDAKKCKHCGEWLDKGNASPSDSARAVAKGIKQKELADFILILKLLASLIASIVVGYYTNILWVAAIVFILCIAFSFKNYWKE